MACSSWAGGDRAAHTAPSLNNQLVRFHERTSDSATGNKAGGDRCLANEHFSNIT